MVEIKQEQINDDGPITKSYLKTILEQSFNDFAVLINGSFADVQRQINRLEDRFDKVDEQFIGLRQQMGSINSRLDNHLLDCVKNERFEGLEKRVLKIEKNIT